MRTTGYRIFGVRLLVVGYRLGLIGLLLVRHAVIVAGGDLCKRQCGHGRYQQRYRDPQRYNSLHEFAHRFLK